MKLLKKAVSALLASVMCIPAGILSFAEAEENTVTTVTLSDTENGFMQFSKDCMESSTASQDGYHMVQINDDGELEQKENDGSMWAFNYGDFVEVELIPDNGFNVESFTIKAADTGDIMAEKRTMDNVFSFTMPGKSILVEAVFSNHSTVEIVEGDKNTGEVDLSSRYHDITQSSEVTKEEVEEAVLDLATESYIKANLDEKYMTVGKETVPVNVLFVNQTIFDGRYVKKEDTLDSIMNTFEDSSIDDATEEENSMKWLGQLEAYTVVYDMDENSDYYVSYADTLFRDESYTVQDWAFAVNNLYGEVREGCIYDENTGLLYIPKKLYDEINEKETRAVGEESIVVQSLQVQFMQVYHDEEEMKNLDEMEVPEMESGISLIDVDEDASAVAVDNDSQDIFSLETVVNADSGMDEDNLLVTVNGVPVPEDEYEYDSETGELAIGMAPSSVVSVEAKEKEETAGDYLVSMIAGRAQAMTKEERYSVMKLFAPSNYL